MPGQAIVTIRDKQWLVDIADTPWELAQGLGGLAEIPPGTGMFFDTGLTQIIQVTAIPVLFPIDIAFLSETLVVTEVYRNIEPGYIVTSTSPARYFLEVNAGEIEGIDSGDQAFIEVLAAPLMMLMETDWKSAMMGFMGFAIMAVFVTAIARDFVKAALEPPEERPVLYGPSGERLLPKAEQPKYERMAYELLENPEFWFDVYRTKDLTGLPFDEASRVMTVLGNRKFLARARAFYEGMRYPPPVALENIKAIEEAIGEGSDLMPQVELVENEDIGLPIPFAHAGIDWIRWETTLADKTVTVEVTGIRGLIQPQLEEAFSRTTAWVPHFVPGQRLPFAAAARRHVWWLATIDDRHVEVHVAGIRQLAETQLEDAFADSVAVMDVAPGIAVHAGLLPQIERRPGESIEDFQWRKIIAAHGKPTRDDVEIGTWAERDRIGIWVTDKRTDKTIAEWWDENAQEMFEQGWFKPGDIRHQTITGRHFEESVLDYLEDTGVLAKGELQLQTGGRGLAVMPKLPPEAYKDFMFRGYIRDLVKLGEKITDEDARWMWEAWKKQEELQKPRYLPSAAEKGNYAWALFDKETGEIMIKQDFSTLGRARSSAIAFGIRRAKEVGAHTLELRLYDRSPDIDDLTKGMIFKGQLFLPEGRLVEEQQKPRVIPTEPRPRRPREEVEFWPDSPEVIAQTIDAIGYREQIDSAFMEAIKRAKGLK